MLELCEAWGIRRIRSYERGHASITIGSSVYRDLGESLETDRVALRWRRFTGSGRRVSRTAAPRE
jgi:hypothetical protein